MLRRIAGCRQQGAVRTVTAGDRRELSARLHRAAMRVPTVRNWTTPAVPAVTGIASVARTTRRAPPLPWLSLLALTSRSPYGDRWHADSGTELQGEAAQWMRTRRRRHYA